MKLNKRFWKQVWNQFDEAVHKWEDEHNKECHACRRKSLQYPDWEDQQEMIQDAVEGLLAHHYEVKNADAPDDK